MDARSWDAATENIAAAVERTAAAANADRRDKREKREGTSRDSFEAPRLNNDAGSAMDEEERAGRRDKASMARRRAAKEEDKRFEDSATSVAAE